MENNLKRYRKPRSDDTQDGVAMQQHDTCISETFKRRFAAIFMKKKLFWGVNRWEKNALVVDSADYDMVWSL